MADVFWLCDNDTQVTVVLPKRWTGICTAIMMTGQLMVLNTPTLKDNRVRRSLTTKWNTDDQVYISWNQEPHSVPSDYHAVGEDWIISGQAVGTIPLWGAVSNVQYIARNSRWVNYLWHNQQRFINWTILALHATSLITLQNRFTIDTLLAEDQGVCSHIRDECCTVIPMHTGEAHKVIKKDEETKDEYVNNSNWNTRAQAILDFFNKLSWTKVLQLIGMVIETLLLTVMLATDSADD